jgi:hypothetical protein
LALRPAGPLGIQDCSVGTIDGMVIVAGGFSRHPKDGLHDPPDAFVMGAIELSA